jgi:hypothetical protein
MWTRHFLSPPLRPCAGSPSRALWPPGGRPEIGPPEGPNDYSLRNNFRAGQRSRAACLYDGLLAFKWLLTLNPSRTTGFVYG